MFFVRLLLDPPIDVAAARYVWKVEPLEIPSLVEAAAKVLNAEAKQKFVTFKDGKAVAIKALNLQGPANLNATQEGENVERAEFIAIELTGDT